MTMVRGNASVNMSAINTYFDVVGRCDEVPLNEPNNNAKHPVRQSHVIFHMKCGYTDKYMHAICQGI